MINIEEVLKKIEPEMDYTIKEVSDMTGSSYSCILGHVKRNNFETRIVFGKYYVKGSTLIEYLNKKPVDKSK